jgi:oligoribonuclease
MGIIAWVDLESTGLDFERDPILEFGLLITSQSSLTTIASAQWVICPPAWPDRKAALNERVFQMHSDNGLIADLDAIWEGEEMPPLIYDVETEIMQFIAQRSPGGGKVPIAGAGTANYDIHAIRAQMPRLTEMLSWWCYDIGHVRRLAKLCGVEPPEEDISDTVKTHRALDDIRLHLAEAKWHMDLWRLLRKSGLRAPVHPISPEEEQAAAVETTAVLWRQHLIENPKVKDEPEALGQWLLSHLPDDALPPEKV